MATKKLQIIGDSGIMPKVSSPTEGDLPVLSLDGTLTDSGVGLLDLTTQLADLADSVENIKNNITIPDGLPELGREGGLNAYTWAEISAVSAANLGDVYWSIGDTHSVALSGTIGTLEIDDTFYAYIIGFNHNRYLEGSGISFGTFKTAQENGYNVALVTNYWTSKTDGTKNFNMNHWGDGNYGGWKGCDLRYDILGSTNTAPSGYGAAVAEGRTGYDASSTTATNPVANTLMAALPSDLRAVMKPITKYSDNYGGNVHNEYNITSSVDYLPLLSEFEIFGIHCYANKFEYRWQEQYSYYGTGNLANRNRHNSTTFKDGISWFERSPICNAGYKGFCTVKYTNGFPHYDNSFYSYGLSPIFMV